MSRGLATLASAALLALGLVARLVGAPPSHLQPHLFEHAPASLLEPLGNGELLKGWSPEDERLLYSDLQAAQLRQRVVKVAVLRSAGLRMAAIKLQAGEWATGRFSLFVLHQDAARVLSTVFDGAHRCDHLDLWAAVSWRGQDGQVWHWPVFSISAWRDRYEEVKSLSSGPAALTGMVSTVRYDPLFLDYVPDKADQIPQAVTMPVPSMDEAPPKPEAAQERRPCTALASGAGSSRTVALTLDDGPHPVITPLILHIIRQADVRATFFLVGEKTLQYPQLVRDILAAGQEIGNHTFTHRRLTDLPGPVIRTELVETCRMITRLGGPPCRLMRPPGGDFDEAALDACRDYGLLPVFWTRNTGDWKERPVRDVVRAALRGVHGGEIILLHQGGPDCVPALAEIISGLRKLGLKPGCVGDLLPNAPVFTGSARHVLAELRAKGCLANE